MGSFIKLLDMICQTVLNTEMALLEYAKQLSTTILSLFLANTSEIIIIVV